MLKHLSIVNYALIDNLSVTFNNGFSVLTGETGAGKSIILGALGLILGNRADSTISKDSSGKCIVEGIFDADLPQTKDFFVRYDLDYSDEVILRREILSSGKSRAFINDTPVNLKQLNELGNLLVNIHSQNETLMLSSSQFQQEVLDGFLANADILKVYRKEYGQYREALKELEMLKEELSVASRDEDYIRFQLKELDNIELNTDMFMELEDKARMLEHSEEIKIALNEADFLIEGDESSVSININRILKVVENVSGYISSGSDILERLRSVKIEINDIADEIRKLIPADDYDSSELQLLNEKIDRVYSLLKKYNYRSVNELSELKVDLVRKLSVIENRDFNLAEAQSKAETLKKKLISTSVALHKKREEGASGFEKSIKETLALLGMKNAGFKVQLIHNNEFLPSGTDIIKFMFNANKGAAPGEISKIASGGELSRLMLAIKSLITQKQMLPTVIFDEIDSGVSGDIAGKVGRILKGMSANHQVIAITHLPQIASKADYHYNVYKTDDDNKTVSSIKLLDNNGRIEELSMMLSAEVITDTARNVAREMLNE